MTYILSDLHGVYSKFLEMLKLIDFKDTDILYILGDAIDRGPENLKCLIKIMNTKNMKMLLGNHEDMMLNYYNTRSYYNKALWYDNGGNVTDKEFNKLNKFEKEQILDYLNNLPIIYNVIIGGISYELLHGSYIFKKKIEDISQYKEKIVWDRIRFNDKGPLDRVVVFGHTPTASYFNSETLENIGHCPIWFNGNLIGMDCGLSGYMSGYAYSCLGCICLETLKEFYV